VASEGVIDRARGVGPGSCRGFGISDAMILTAGAALALSASMHLIVFMASAMGRLGAEASAHGGDPVGRWPAFWGATHDHLRNALWYGFQVAEALVFGFTPAFLAVRLRRPRPPWGALIRQPGLAACLAMVFGLFWGTGALLTWFPGRFESVSAAPSAVGAAVVLAWGMLVLSRKWEAEPGWIDRMGRLLGCVAVGNAVLLPLVFRI